MKDSSVGPTKLLNVHRCSKLLESLGSRITETVEQRRDLQASHSQVRSVEESDLAKQRGSIVDQCRQQRYDMLSQWDLVEEETIAQYERRAVATRAELNRLAILGRKEKAMEEEAIDRKVEARSQAVSQQYVNRKNQPGQQKRKEVKQIDEALGPIREHVEWARALTVRRLDGLPEVGAAMGDEEGVVTAKPESVKDTLDAIAILTRKCKQIVGEMQTGAASKIVDSFYLPAGVAVFLVIWSVVAMLVVENHRYLWAAVGIIPAGVLGFSIYLILLWPLKKMTRQLYPKVERIRRAAEQAAETGRNVSKKVAADTSKELVDRRNAHLEAAKRWKGEQLAALKIRLEREQTEKRKHLLESMEVTDKEFAEKIQAVTTQMHGKAESVAKRINDTLSKADQALQQQRESTAGKRFLEQQHLAMRLKAGVGGGLDRMQKTADEVHGNFPDWSKWIDQNFVKNQQVDYLPLGSLRVHDHLSNLMHSQDTPGSEIDDLANEVVPDLLGNMKIPASIPIVIHRRLHSAVVITADEISMDAAIECAHQMLWRLLAAAPPARAKLTLIDPVGRGQHFTSFMALTDHDPSLVGHRVWTTDAKIEARLGELAHHVEDVLQSSLRDRFERIEDYNVLAGSMAEPYRGVAAVGFPEGLSREGYKHLQALIESGLRCGIFTVLVCDASKPWPSDMPMPSGDKVLSLRVDAKNGWRLQSDGLDHLPFDPATAPPSSLRESLVEKIGDATVQAAKVEIPLDNILAGVLEGKGSTDAGIAIAIGSQGANRSLSLDLGEGVRQHVLIAGKTGSGKSTLLHSILTAGAYQYRPDQLQFYLLDFKKGVEFKVYAETELPHARVIGIESEREFGRSVLQRLDEEMQQRGEAFRAANAQELEEYRQSTGKMMPRIALVIDEFQELFVRDDRIAGDCSMLLDRLVRQGRSFGIHVILSSQSLAGAHSLPRATLGQMAVRIAMQCSESDAALILSDDNTAARLISRPGEAIYNDAGGLVEGNQPFQVAWLTSKRHREILSSITARDEVGMESMPPPVIFEGNRPCRWTPRLADAAIDSASSGAINGLLGESVEIGPPVSISVTRDSGRNLMVVASGDARMSAVATAIAGFAKSAGGRLKVIHFDGFRVDDGTALGPWLQTAGINRKTVKTRDSESEMVQLSELIKERGDDAADSDPMLVVIDPLERFRDLRQDESFNFNLDAAAGASGASALQSVLKDGPAAGIFAMVICGGAETLSRWLPRASLHDLELRILGQMNQNDSSMLIDAPTASDLSAATMLLYDHADGRVAKFRQCQLPDAGEIKTWLDSN